MCPGEVRLRQAILEKVEDFTARLRGRSVVRASIDASSAAVLVCTRDVAAAAPFGARAGRGVLAGQSGHSTNSYPVEVLRHTGGRWATLLEAEYDFVYPHAQPLAGGSVLVVGSHSRRQPGGNAERNATIFSATGAERERFVAGDGVDDVQADSAGRFWTSYFDQGTTGDFGRLGWGRLSSEIWIPPIGLSGLVFWDERGNRLWEFAPPADFLPISDCWALNLCDDTAWISYHPSFPLVSVAPTAVRGRHCEFGLVTAIAVSGERALIYGGNSVAPHRCAAGRLDATKLIDLVELELCLSDHQPLESLIAVKGRGQWLNAFSERAWYRLDLAQLRA
jgi:hypothetical protein